jgi:hypothetical protein
MKLQDTVISLRDRKDTLTAKERETLSEICASFVDLSSAKEKVSPEQRELVDDLLRITDELAYAAYRLAAALQSR